METITIEGEPILLDLLLWRRYGVDGQALLEQTLELNHGISANAVIPLGTVVILPGAPTRTVGSTNVVTLFG